MVYGSGRSEETQMPETTVRVQELESDLDSYLRQVKSGTNLVITEDGNRWGNWCR